MQKERTFLMIKPDGIQRGLAGEIMSRFERKGFKLVGAKFLMPSRELAEKHYAEHEGKSFYEVLISFITSGPVLAMVWEGDNIIALSRMMNGKTDVTQAQPGTIRGDFASHTNLNLIHGSDSPESAAREIANFFKEDELVSYDRTIEAWM